MIQSGYKPWQRPQAISLCPDCEVAEGEQHKLMCPKRLADQEQFYRKATQILRLAKRAGVVF